MIELVTLEQAEAQGSAGADKGARFAQDCPYTHRNLPASELHRFIKVWRPLMNAWFKGWDARRKEIEEEHA